MNATVTIPISAVMSPITDAAFRLLAFLIDHPGVEMYEFQAFPGAADSLRELLGYGWIGDEWLNEMIEELEEQP